MISVWTKRLLVCNPFYLVSGPRCYLYGFYLVSADNNSRQRNRPINFPITRRSKATNCCWWQLQRLARRRNLVRSTLLIGLENLLVLVPFILLTQGALIAKRRVDDVFDRGLDDALSACESQKNIFTN